MTAFVINDRLGVVHDATCPRLARTKPENLDRWDPAKAHLAPGVTYCPACLSKVPADAPARDAADRADLGAVVNRLLDEHWPNSGVNGWYLTDLLREQGVRRG